MSTLNEAVEDFLAHKRIAVAGVSRSGSKVKSFGAEMMTIPLRF